MQLLTPTSGKGARGSRVLSSSGAEESESVPGAPLSPRASSQDRGSRPHEKSLRPSASHSPFSPLALSPRAPRASFLPRAAAITYHARFARLAFGLHFGQSLWRLSLPCPRGSLHAPPHLRHVLLPLAQEPREAQFKQRWLRADEGRTLCSAAPAPGKNKSQVRQVNQPARPHLGCLLTSATQSAQTAAHGMVAIALLNSEICFVLSQTEHSKMSTSFKHLRQRRFASESSC